MMAREAGRAVAGKVPRLAARQKPGMTAGLSPSGETLTAQIGNLSPSPSWGNSCAPCRAFYPTAYGGGRTKLPAGAHPYGTIWPDGLIDIGQSQCSPVQVALAPVARGRERLACRPRVGRRRRQSPYLNTTASHGDHRPRHDRYVSGTRIDFDRPSGNRPTDRDGGSDRTRLTRTQAYPPMKGPWQVSRLRAGQPRALS